MTLAGIEPDVRNEERRLVRTAALAAMAVHLSILLVPLPSRTSQPPPTPERTGIRIVDLELRPPKPPDVPDRPVRKRTRTLPIPMPDTAELLEPEAEPESFPHDDFVPGENAVLIPDVEPPPRPDGPLTLDVVGLEPPVPGPDRLRPTYPPLGRRLGREAVVLLEVVVDKQGRVGSMRVLSAPELDLGFEDAALDAVARWRYEPGRLRGEPVEVSIKVRVEFTLD